MPRTKRRTENQKLFREVNERIAELWIRLEERDAPLSIVCECSRVGCAERGAVPIETYGRVRDDLQLFVVVCGHEDPEHEQTVEVHGGFIVVRPFEHGPSESRAAA